MGNRTPAARADTLVPPFMVCIFSSWPIHPHQISRKTAHPRRCRLKGDLFHVETGIERERGAEERQFHDEGKQDRRIFIRGRSIAGA
jgi:hypothetical protein